MKREIFMRNGGYLMCDGITDTAGEHTTLRKKDVLLMQTPDGRQFLAIQAYGTWCEASLEEIINFIKLL